MDFVWEMDFDFKLNMNFNIYPMDLVIYTGF